ncbi:hypothetical protein N7530_001179 [Penicillium desertorum]|uniref:NodB homology domain-containing protein n=1 Tax=Penicillium desertorum TaxID=1303715 RepID=A0A9W9X9G8_9EURO|nr:hypothetical protein N7530_001179 [Penicillium desertorum]
MTGTNPIGIVSAGYPVASVLWSMTLCTGVVHPRGVALSKNPTFSKALVRDGHEIATHGLRWKDFWDFNLEEDKEYVKQSLLMLKEVTGEMPVGAYFGRGTPQTHHLFSEIGKGLGAEFLWSSECYNDDVPYWLDLPWEKHLPENEPEGMLLIPYNRLWVYHFLLWHVVVVGIVLMQRAIIPILFAKPRRQHLERLCEVEDMIQGNSEWNPEMQCEYGQNEEQPATIMNTG